MQIKRKTVRQDGKMFWAYRYKQGQKKEVWLSPDVFKKWDETRRKYARKQYDEFLKKYKNGSQDKKYCRGEHDPETGLYFIRVSTCGKPVWGSIEELQKYIGQNRKAKRKYYSRCSSLNPPSVCVGDPHPTTAGLVVKRIYGHKVYYGTIEEAKKHTDSRKESYKKYKQKNKEAIKQRSKNIRNARMEKIKMNPILKRRRGDIDPVLGKIFWEYNYLGNEIWIHKDDFEKKHAKIKQDRKKYHLKRKEAGNDRGSVSNKNNQTIIC